LNVDQISDEEFPRDRKLPPLERMAMAAVRQAMVGQATEHLGLVYGTGFGNLRATVDLMEGVASRGFSFGSPTAFQQSVHHSVAGQVSLAFGIRGPAITVSNREVSGEGALKVAVDLIASGRCPKVLVVAADEITPCLSSAYQAFGIEPKTVGEGCAALVLARAKSPLQIRRVVLKSHSTSGMRYPTSGLAPLLRDAMRDVTGEVIVSCGTSELAEQEALQSVLPDATLFQDWRFFGRNASGGLLRTVASALRIQERRKATAVIHGIALGGAQSLVILNHEPN
jgi:hypothetical protein